jgi:hypothetical protein
VGSVASRIGPVLVERVRQRDPAARIIYMSGYAPDTMPAGEFLQKPFTRAVLLRKLGEGQDGGASVRQ